MKIPLQFINNYLLPICLICFCGCQSTEEAKNSKKVTTIEFYLEVNADGTNDNGPIELYRASPVVVNIHKTPFLDGGYISSAKVIDDPLGGGFDLMIQFDDHGTRVLDSYTNAYRGQRIAIFCHWGEENTRYVAAPLIRYGIPDGTLTFVADLDRDEADRIVMGINNVAQKIKKSSWFSD